MRAEHSSRTGSEGEPAPGACALAVASRRRRCVALRCAALCCAASRRVALRRRFTNVSLPRARQCPFTPPRRRNATRECVYSSSLPFSPHTLPRRWCLAATSTRWIVFTLGIVAGELSVSFPPPSIPPLPFSRLYVPLSLSLSLCLLPPDCFSRFLSRSFSRVISLLVSLPLSAFSSLLLYLALFTSRDPSLTTTAERDGRDVNGANFRSRIDFLSGSSRRHRDASSRFSRAALR